MATASTPFSENPNLLNLRPGAAFETAAPAVNPLTFALNVLAPHRISPRMLEGLKEDRSPLTQLTRSVEPAPPLQQFNNPALTNEQLAQLALRQVMHR